MTPQPADSRTRTAPRSTYERPPSTEGDGPEVRAAILEAAVDLFYRNGYQATSVRDIVERAGYTKGALYHYFPSKEHILLQIHDVFMTYAVSRGREILAQERTASEALVMIMTELLRQVSLYRPHMAIVLQETRLIDFTKYPEARAKRDEWENMFVEIIDRGIRDGEFRDDIMSSRVLSFGLGGMCVWAYHWLSDPPALDIDEISEMFTTIVLDGLRSQHQPSGGAATAR